MLSVLETTKFLDHQY